MSTKRIVEVFTSGCSLCDEAVVLVKKLVCGSCDVAVLDMKDKSTAEKAEKLGVKKVPAVVVDGQLADCCSTNGITEAGLKAAGIGIPL